jgi:hypothetical protein
MGASPDGILIFPLLPDDDAEEEAAEGEEEGNAGGVSGVLSRMFSGSKKKEKTKGATLSAVERDIARAVLAAAAAAKNRGGDDGGDGGGDDGGGKKNNNKKRSANAKKKKKNQKKKKNSSTTLHDDADDKKQLDDDAPPWGAAIPAGYGAVAVEVKVSSPFRWSTQGLTSFNNMASYKVDWSADLPRDHVQALHAPQLQLEALVARVPGTLLVSYTPAGAGSSSAAGKKGGGGTSILGGGGGGGGGARMFYVPADPLFQKSALGLLREHVVDGLLPGCFSSSGGGGGGGGGGSAERREAYGAFLRRTRRVAAGAVAIADLAPVAPAPGTDTEPFLRLSGGG